MPRIAGTLLLAATVFLATAHGGEVVVIANGNVPKLDLSTVQKIFSGKFISVSGVSVRPVGVKAGSEVRDRFLRDYLNQDEEKFTAYWTVRRYIGMGAPPVELGSAEDVISYVRATPGAVGYIDEAELKPGMNVVARK